VTDDEHVGDGSEDDCGYCGGPCENRCDNCDEPCDNECGCRPEDNPI